MLVGSVFSFSYINLFVGVVVVGSKGIYFFGIIVCVGKDVNFWVVILVEVGQLSVYYCIVDFYFGFFIVYVYFFCIQGEII